MTDATDYFADLPLIKYEGPDSDNELAYRFYDKSRVVMGKTMEEQLRFLIKVPSIVLANLILGENAIPEFVQWDCTPDKLAGALLALGRDTPERRAQLAAFARLDAIMEVGSSTSPSQRAAAIVAEIAGRGRAPGPPRD